MDRPTLTLDIETYLGQMEDWDITEAEKEDLLIALWGLLISFAEIGFDIHPVQRVLSSRAGEKRGNPAHDMLHSNCSLQHQIIHGDHAEESTQDQGGPA